MNITEVVKEELMYKYHVALYFIKETLSVFHFRTNSEVPRKETECLNTLKELVDKATPKKPKEKHFEIHGYPRFDYSCPNCNMHLGLDISPLKKRHCSHCGQALDWSDVEL